MLGQPRQALEDARTSTTLEPAFEKGWTRLARCCVLLGDTVTAKQALTRLGELGGENPTEQRNVEVCISKDYVKSNFAITRWLLILSFFLQKVVDRLKTDGQQAYQASDYRRALYCLDKALEIATHSLLLKTSRAECLAFLGRYTEVDNNCLQSPTLPHYFNYLDN